MEHLFNSLRDSTGGNQDIYNAMDSDDLADVVRATTRVLEKTYSLPMHVQEKKSAELSNNFRTKGNVYYKNGQYKATILLYNKALAYAPNNSIELKLAYANFSALMFTIKAYEECLEHINACFALGCPQELKLKLQKRMDKAKKSIIIKEWSDEVLKYLAFDVARNSEVPCASNDINFLNVNGSIKVVAARDIKPGTIVTMERAFVSTQTDDNQYTSCYYCHKIAIFFVPCEGCCKALFCSKSCRTKCLDDYHHVECQIVAYMGSMYVQPVNKLMTRAAIKISLKLGWEKLCVISQEVGEKILNKSPINSAFDVNDPISMLCYDDQKAINQGKIYNGSFIAAAAVHCLRRVRNYFPKAVKARNKAINALSRTMLHLYSTFTNRIVIKNPAYDYYTERPELNIQNNVGWFSFSSKLKHSCEPNLIVSGLNDKVTLAAVKPVKKGEELTITYVDHFYETEIRRDRSEKFSNVRQLTILRHIQLFCECRVCVRRWDSNTHVAAIMTERQHDAYYRLMDVVTKMKDYPPNFSESMRVCCTALDVLSNLVNTTEHKHAFSTYTGFLLGCQCITSQNKTCNKM